MFRLIVGPPRMIEANDFDEKEEFQMINPIPLHWNPPPKDRKRNNQTADIDNLEGTNDNPIEL